jgi:catechol 2,3-dioxygenase-like lactoylglutathione lyase family enzyme
MAGIVKDAYVTIEVADLGRAVGFYTRVLGLKLVKRYGDFWADIKAPGTWIGLHLAHEGGRRRKGSGNMSVGFDVRDMDKAVKALKKRGVKVKRQDSDWGRMAEFCDPDGTDLYFWQEV